ncbi:type II secretion system protein F [Desulfosarcina ovata subsp. sediminis]|uniref:Type II secretion system protein F n=1 Tax=Desulfosarcina ovata subsp. sediminis TaxID=885957 RepID=A0A5K8A295_9BACT|nr:type II secretion system F family protein [Desulfosarcina ovata]BBO86508.1 type II secretion system protein F [Desulfosarcina ovata subsp. sediminis]
MRVFLALIVFLLVLALIAGFYWILSAIARREKRQQLRVFLKSQAVLPVTPASSEAAASGGSSGRVLWGVVDLARLETLLMAADVPIPAQRMAMLAILLGLAGFFAILAVAHNFIGALLAMGAGIGLPLAILLYRRRRRDEALVRQMPDALDMIVRALRVGQSVDNALKEAGRSIPAPLGTEIQTIYEEMSLGIAFSVAMQNFEARFTRLADVKLMTTAFIIQRETGGNLTRVLANLSDLIRDRDTLKRQVRAMTAEGRSSAFILGVLPLAVGFFFWIIRPVYIQMLFSHPLGRKMLIVAILLETAGFVIMKLMTRIET